MKKIIPKISTEKLSAKTGASNTANTETTKTDSLFETQKTENTTKIYTPGEKTGSAPTIDEKKAEEYATDLFNAMKGIGASGKTVDNILLNSELNSYDIVSIIDKYASVSDHHFLAKDLASNFMGKHEDKLLQKLMGSCFEVWADESSENIHLNWRARNALSEETMQKFMADEGYIERDTSGIRTSDMIVGIRG